MKQFDLDYIKQNPLTQMPNIFSLIDLDMKKVFGKCGVILMADYKKFEHLNKRYGRKKGDECLAAIGKGVLRFVDNNENINILFSAKDEFTLVFRESCLDDAKKTANQLLSYIKKVLCDLGIEAPDFHENFLTYKEEINHIEDYYKFLYRNRIEEGRFKTEFVFLQAITENFKYMKDAVERLTKASELAITDDVSGLKNQRAAVAYLESIPLKLRDSISNGILFIDGDNLKRYNSISYQAGNDMIRNLGVLLTETLREGDQVFRWLSGDEFVVVLKSIQKGAIEKIADRIRQHIEEGTKTWTYPVTVSIGADYYDNQTEHWEKVIQNAEKANAMAKAQGKNQVILWTENAQ